MPWPGWGLLVCMLSMLAGGAVEWYRLRLFAQGRVLTAQVRSHPLAASFTYALRRACPL